MVTANRVVNQRHKNKTAYRSMSSSSKIAFDFAGGGSLGAVQVGMLKALDAYGIKADYTVSSLVGAINAAYYASNPSASGIRVA